MKILRFVLLIVVMAFLAGCMKPYHFDDDWWEEKVEARDTDWGPEIKGEKP